MHILILHLSDIHFQETKQDNIILERIGEIGNIVAKYSKYEILKCFCLVTGDIANTGKDSEYSLAYDFFYALKREIKSINDSLDIDYVILPGNHDCNLEEESDSLRDKTIQTMEEGEDLADLSIVKKCTSVQEEFFHFLSEFLDIRELENRLYYKLDFPIQNYKICFNCFNTAWMSLKKDKQEDQGHLIFPVDIIRPKFDERDCKLVISAFHHPYNWLEAKNSRKFQNLINQSSDIIFTGHEHVPDQAMQTKISGEVQEFIEGGILQKKGSKKSSFNMVIIDLDSSKHQVIQHHWKEGIYHEDESTDWIPIRRKRRHQFTIDKEFANDLNDPGLIIQHTKPGKHKLNDIFVYPWLREQDIESKSREDPYNVIEGDEVLDYVLNRKKLVITGAYQSGKTTLAKKLYLDLLDKGFIPVLIDPNSISGKRDKDKHFEVIEDKFCEQYSLDDETLEKYQQIDKDKKVIIVDDFHKARPNLKGRAYFIKTIAKCANRIILFSDKSHTIEKFFQQKQKEDSVITDFSVCEILEFGQLLRRNLIRKWLQMGNEFTLEEKKLSRQVEDKTRVINTILMRDLFPPYPFFLMILLKKIEEREKKEQEPSRMQGSFGYLYQSLITLVLSKTSPKLSMAAKYTYLSLLAYHKFSNGRSILKKSDLENVASVYHEQYAQRIKIDKFQDDLVKARVLSRSDGGYKFTYDYLYYYFVANYMHDQMRKEEEAIKKHIVQMSKKMGLLS